MLELVINNPDAPLDHGGDMYLVNQVLSFTAINKIGEDTQKKLALCKERQNKKKSESAPTKLNAKYSSSAPNLVKLFTSTLGMA